jgi:hypothetical protein
LIPPEEAKEALVGFEDAQMKGSILQVNGS